MRIVENDEARILEEVGPHEIVAPGVPELVHDEVVRRLLVQPDEVVGGAGGEVLCVRAGELGGRRDEHVHVVCWKDAGQCVNGILRHAARDRRQRGEPGKPHSQDLTPAPRREARRRDER